MTADTRNAGNVYWSKSPPVVSALFKGKIIKGL